jgi:hypothetical protein
VAAGERVTQPFLQLEQGHRLLGVVELTGDRGPRPVAGDVAADVGGWDTGLGTECRNDAFVQVPTADALGSVGEQQVHPLTGLAVQDGGLGWPDRLPGGDSLPQQRVYRLGEGGAGLVHRDIEQADGVLGEYLILGAGDVDVIVLPANAPDPQPDDLVAA